MSLLCHISTIVNIERSPFIVCLEDKDFFVLLESGLVAGNVNKNDMLEQGK
jgi:hypothetical protein